MAERTRPQKPVRFFTTGIIESVPATRDRAPTSFGAGEGSRRPFAPSPPRREMGRGRRVSRVSALWRKGGPTRIGAVGPRLFRDMRRRPAPRSGPTSFFRKRIDWPSQELANGPAQAGGGRGFSSRGMMSHNHRASPAGIRARPARSRKSRRRVFATLWAVGARKKISALAIQPKPSGGFGRRQNLRNQGAAAETAESIMSSRRGRKKKKNKKKKDVYHIRHARRLFL